MKKHPSNKGVVVAKPGQTEAMTRKVPPPSLREDHAASPGSPAGDEPARLNSSNQEDMDRRQEILESIPESERWDPVPGSVEHQEPESPSEDEDNEGRSETEQLVDDGAVEAAREQTQQESQAADDKDRNGL
jgi:hypothetical protein